MTKQARNSVLMALVLLATISSSSMAVAQTRAERYEAYRNVMRGIEAQNPSANQYLDQNTQNLIEQRTRERMERLDASDNRAELARESREMDARNAAAAQYKIRTYGADSNAGAAQMPSGVHHEVCSAAAHRATGC